METIRHERQYDEAYRQRHHLNLSPGSIAGIVIAPIAAAILATFFGVIYFEHSKSTLLLSPHLSFQDPQITLSTCLPTNAD